MQCEEVQNHFADYLAGSLPEPIQSEVLRHLFSCTLCREEAEELADVWIKGRSIPAARFDSSAMRSRFNSALKTYSIREKRQHSYRSWIWPRRPIIQVLLGMLALAAGVFAAQQTGVLTTLRIVPETVPQLTPSAASTPQTVRQNGIITGRVLSADGTPAAGIRVALAEPGQANTTLTNLSKTNSDGDYRISEIAPGRYVIVAGAVETPTYYPATADVAAAQVISVAAGSVTGGLDLTIVTPPVSPQDPAAQRSTMDAALLALSRATASGLKQTPPGPGRIAGRVVFEEKHQWPDFRFLVTMSYAYPNGSGTGRSTISEQGTFQFRVGVPSTVVPQVEARIGITGRDSDALPDDYYVKSISDGSVDLLKSAIKLDKANGPEVVIELATGQPLSGNVRLENGEPAANITFTLRALSVTNHDQFNRIGITDQNGGFVMRGVAPFQYILSTPSAPGSVPVEVTKQPGSLLNLILEPGQSLSVK